MIKLMLGDCLEMMRGMDAGSIHCCVTSPPYFGLRDYGVDGQIGLEATPEAYVAKMVDVFREVRRVLRYDGTLWLNLGDSYANDGKWGGTTGGKHADGLHGSPIGRLKRETGLKPKNLIGIPWRVAFALQADGWYLRSDIIWNKPNPMPESVRDRPTKSHEYIFLLAKSDSYYYDADATKEERDSVSLYPGNKDPGKIQGTKAHQGGNSQFRDSRQRAWGDLSGRNKRSVWTVATKPCKDAHFATFPPKLIEPCILAGCPAGGVVLDPFSGAGTTGVVAKQHGRSYVGIELNPEYIEMSRKRIDETRVEMPLFNAPKRVL
jgi:DNA modification methylase